MMSRCNGSKECNDGSDETSCESCNLTTSFRCFDGSCLLLSMVCDGFVDCPEAVANDESYTACTPVVKDCVDVWVAGKRKSQTYQITDGSYIDDEKYDVECNFERTQTEYVIETVFQNVDFLHDYKYLSGEYANGNLDVSKLLDFTEIYGFSTETFQTARPKSFLPRFMENKSPECYQSFIQTCPPYRMMKASMLNLVYHREYWDCLCIERRIWINGSSSWITCSNATKDLQERGLVDLEIYWMIDLNYHLNLDFMNYKFYSNIPFDKDTSDWKWDRAKIRNASLDGHGAKLEFILGPVKCIHVVDSAIIDGDLACERGKPVPVSIRCLNDYDEDGHVIGCRDLTHLQSCESFTCPVGYVKCPDSFCLPIRFLCDGDVDCLHGEDEMECNTTKTLLPDCDGLFRCRNSQMCIPVSRVCDGMNHCPAGDDERLCNYACLPGCGCSGYETRCHLENIHNLTLLDIKTRSLDVSGSYSEGLPALHLPSLALFNASSCGLKTLIPEIFSSMRNLLVLDLRNNLFSKFLPRAFNGLQKVRTLLLHGNYLLSFISPGTFRGLYELQSLRIKSTQITHLYGGTFDTMGNLFILDISDNKIVSVEDGAFTGLTNLSLLDISRNSIQSFANGIFDGLDQLENLKSDAYKFCCLKPSTVTDENCLPRQDEFSSCSDLMRYDGPRVLLWLIGISALLGNTMSIIYRVTFDRKRLKMGYGVFVSNLVVSDFLMGVYLIIIAGADLHFRGRYIWSDDIWRNSGLCTFAGVLAALSSEASVCFICFITLDRLLVIKYPFGNKTFSILTASITSALCWILAITVSVLPLVYKEYFKTAFYSKNAVCLALPLTRDRPPGWMYSLSVFVFFNFLTFILIAVGQCIIYREIKSTKTKPRSNKKHNDLLIARNLLFVVATDFLCWFPIGVMGMMALTGYVISGDVYVWACVLILPINSALNPFLYTFSAVFKKKQFAPRITELAASIEIDFNVVTKLLKSRIVVLDVNPGSKLLGDYTNACDVTLHQTLCIVWMTTCRLSFLHHYDMYLGSMNEQKIAIYENNKSLNGMSMSILPKMATKHEEKQNDIYLLGEMARKFLTACKRNKSISKNV